MEPLLTFTNSDPRHPGAEHLNLFGRAFRTPSTHPLATWRWSVRSRDTPGCDLSTLLHREHSSTRFCFRAVRKGGWVLRWVVSYIRTIITRVCCQAAVVFFLTKQCHKNWRQYAAATSSTVMCATQMQYFWWVKGRLDLNQRGSASVR